MCEREGVRKRGEERGGAGGRSERERERERERGGGGGGEKPRLVLTMHL